MCYPYRALDRLKTLDLLWEQFSIKTSLNCELSFGNTTLMIVENVKIILHVCFIAVIAFIPMFKIYIYYFLADCTTTLSNS